MAAVAQRAKAGTTPGKPAAPRRKNSALLRGGEASADRPVIRIGWLPSGGPRAHATSDQVAPLHLEDHERNARTQIIPRLIPAAG